MNSWRKPRSVVSSLSLDVVSPSLPRATQNVQPVGRVIVLRVEHHMLLLPIAYELFEGRVVRDVNSPSFRTATCSSANYEERYEHTMAVAGFLDTTGYDDCFDLFRQCPLTSKLQSYRFGR